jgi:hypothetical protein
MNQPDHSRQVAAGLVRDLQEKMFWLPPYDQLDDRQNLVEAREVEREVAVQFGVRRCLRRLFLCVEGGHERRQLDPVRLERRFVEEMLQLMSYGSAP